VALALAVICLFVTILRPVGYILLGTGLTLEASTIVGQITSRQQDRRSTTLWRRAELYDPLHEMLHGLVIVLSRAGTGGLAYPWAINTPSCEAMGQPDLTFWTRLPVAAKVNDFLESTRSSLDELVTTADEYNRISLRTAKRLTSLLASHLHDALTLLFATERGHDPKNWENPDDWVRQWRDQTKTAGGSVQAFVILRPRLGLTAVTQPQERPCSAGCSPGEPLKAACQVPPRRGITTTTTPTFQPMVDWLVPTVEATLDSAVRP
jgi:hypothetical protein